MKNSNALIFILLTQLFLACGPSKSEKDSFFAFDVEHMKSQCIPGESIEIAMLNSQNKTVDSIVYYLNEQKVKSTNGLGKFELPIKGEKLGYQNLKAQIYFENDFAELTTRIEVVSSQVPAFRTYKIVNTYAHDTLSFTEGLEFYRDTLYESTGQKGASHLRSYDYKTGKVVKQINLDPEYFGEGITAINSQWFQLTWQSNVGFIYDANTLKKIKTFTYDKPIEGWGLTNDGQFIYQSDGTEKIWKMNPTTQKMDDYINVYTNTNKIKSINELEWVEGKIYGNIWQKDAIAIINPSSGEVEGVLDLSGLRAQVKNASAEVLNGIAYNKKTKTLFVTGKNWDKLFEITLTK
jgi:glutamine cyclotransferase